MRIFPFWKIKKILVTLRLAWRMSIGGRLLIAFNTSTFVLGHAHVSFLRKNTDGKILDKGYCLFVIVYNVDEHVLDLMGQGPYLENHPFYLKYVVPRYNELHNLVAKSTREEMLEFISKHRIETTGDLIKRELIAENALSSRVQALSQDVETQTDEQLHQLLEVALEEEDYETASKIRDEIKRRTEGLHGEEGGEPPLQDA